MRRGVAVVVAAAVGSGGCSLLTSLDGLSGAPDAADAAEAAADVLDGSAEGASPSGDGGLGCSALGTHAFCADFDTVATVEQGWSLEGTAAFDTALSRSPPRSALLRVPASSAACVYAELWRTFPGTLHHARLSAWLRVGEADPSAAMAQGFLLAAGIGPKCTIRIAPHAPVPEVFVEEDPSGHPSEITPFTATVTRGQWSHVTLDVDSTTSPNVVFTIDDAVALSLTTLPSVCQVTGAVSVGIGPHCIQPSANPVTARFDDVTVDVQ